MVDKAITPGPVGSGVISVPGSMSGVKRQEACKAAAVIEEGFKNLMPMKIVAFDYSGHPIHEIIKDWDEKHKKNMCYNFMLHGRNGCGNDDGEDIAKATEELVKRKEQKKMLIVLSDGAPADEAKVKKAVENARDKGISVFGIYFENGRIGSDADTFREMYQKDFVCCRLSELDGELTKLLLKFSRS